MLNRIPRLMTPDLLKELWELGHGDTLVICDGNFPAKRIAAEAGAPLIRCDTVGTSELLEAILELFPLDAYCETPVMLMERMDCDRDMELPILDRYQEIVAKYDARGSKAIGAYERFSFYEHAAKASLIIATGETSQYANIMLQKGIVKDWI